MTTLRELDVMPRAARPPRAIAWVALLAAAAAVLAVGIVATVLLLTNLGGFPVPRGRGFWAALLGASVLTVASISLRGLRWVFLLRRADVRIPIRDAYIGYFSGFALLFAPLLAGEIAVRAYINRARGGVPVHATVVVNVWERLLDLCALAVLAVGAGLAANQGARWIYVLAGCALCSLITPVRRLALATVAASTRPIAAWFDEEAASPFRRMADLRVWTTSLATSIVAWLMPAIGLWLIGASETRSFSIADATYTYGSSAAATVITLVPGGVVVAGRQMLAALAMHGLGADAVVLAVLGIRLATVGVSVAFGIVFVLVHLRSAPADGATHFDDVADAYDVQIPESRRHALLVRKTELMAQAIEGLGVGRRGLDVGCGQGAYVARMRALGFDVTGIDASAGQVRRAVRNVGAEGIVGIGSVLDIPAPDTSFDFAYIINVLHHLGSIDEQRCAFAELFRVLRPGGLLFVHEINTRNVVFRFYMGYVFPSLNCIDEGVERWLLPHKLGLYTDAAVVDVRYFTFLPDFLPEAAVRLLSPVERALERSAVRVFSAHYMAVLRKPDHSGGIRQ